MSTTIDTTAFDKGTDPILKFFTVDQAREIVNFRGDAPLQARIEEIAENPKRFTLLDPIRGLRRAKLRKFPYMILYYITAHGVKITCVKHEKRHPNAGMSRR